MPNKATLHTRPQDIASIRRVSSWSARNQIRWLSFSLSKHETSDSRAVPRGIDPPSFGVTVGAGCSIQTSVPQMKRQSFDPTALLFESTRCKAFRTHKCHSEAALGLAIATHKLRVSRRGVFHLILRGEHQKIRHDACESAAVRAVSQSGRASFRDKDACIPRASKSSF